jgi:hypothetical protein
MTNYQKWMSGLDKEFITFIHGNKEIPKQFKDLTFVPVTLKELKQLDNRFINDDSESR